MNVVSDSGKTGGSVTLRDAILAMDGWGIADMHAHDIASKVRASGMHASNEEVLSELLRMCHIRYVSVFNHAYFTMLEDGRSARTTALARVRNSNRAAA